MKIKPIFAALSVFLVAGCCSPYDYSENWLIREDATRPFAVPSDLIYVQSIPYTNVSEIAKIITYTRNEVGNGKLGGLSRVFAPLVSNSEDVKMALEWYLRHQHESGRPFVFIGEGVCGALLEQYEADNAEDLKDMGLVASFYTKIPHSGFVTKKTVQEIRNALARRRYREQWNRDMPSDMLVK